jgi:hypothetical protein
MRSIKKLAFAGWEPLDERSSAEPVALDYRCPWFNKGFRTELFPRFIYTNFRWMEVGSRYPLRPLVLLSGAARAGLLLAALQVYAQLFGEPLLTAVFSLGIVPAGCFRHCSNVA